ncbi:MAG: hypothetical protein GC160_02905 [Acidobacteria bacterium]|nr:hypothetical protein [Acidobacteriota bacterium]
MPDSFQGHIDAALSMYAQRYVNRDLIADIVAPRVPVGRQSDKYWQWGREDMQGAAIDDTRAPGAGAIMVTKTLSSDLYHCPDHARKAVIADEEAANYDAGDLRQEYTGTLTNQVLLGHEYRTAQLLTTPGNFPSGNKVQLSSNDQWNSGDAAAQPVEDIMTGRDAIVAKTGMKPNVLVLGYQVYSGLKNNAALIERIKYTKLGNPNEQDLAQLFEVDRVVIGSAISRSAAGVNSYIWGKHAVLLYVQPTPSRTDISAAKTFVWTGAPGTSGGFQTAFYRHPEEDRKADVGHVHFYHNEKVTASDAMYLIEDAVA